ncbi:hypothetical protein [Candidatus Symbiobacter mobilis]|uniref:hypothetical protein n=1 Tax=Candidatus Symbiobacter mobilis TaxID=1436290 RepID=UPI0016516F5D|nr:hypothetical protein [Candidatus Symbiobacter mobilis]
MGSKPASGKVVEVVVVVVVAHDDVLVEVVVVVVVAMVFVGPVTTFTQNPSLTPMAWSKAR